ncbi:MAG: AAA family ATPase [bacterium]|nr:AAA family ATPase [bacterium]
MLILSKVRLINWHFFTDSVIDIQETTLFAGDNASGKSTIIDAIQYALVANIRKIKFNAAAADKKGSRTLESYCRCKIGSETLSYVRDDTITHVMLQFENNAVPNDPRVFCAGIMVEAFKEKGDTNEHLWVLESGRIEEVEVYSGETFLTPSEFKERLKRINGVISASKRDYNSKLTHLLGVHRRNTDFNPYLEAVIRAVNFTPFSSVDRFVCDYILDERQVDISAMRENLANYKEAEKEAGLIGKKIDALEEIEKAHNEMEQVKKQIIMQEYFKKRIDLELCREDLAKTALEHEEASSRLHRLEEAIQQAREQKGRKESLLRETQAALYRNDEHALFTRLQGMQEEMAQKLKYENERFNKYRLFRQQSETLLGRTLDESPEREIEILEKEKGGILDERASLKIEAASLKSELGDRKRELEDLEKGILRYPESTMALKKALANAGINAQIFADLLDVTDELWQNAVEGWLNTQRFNILVPERDFQKAIEVYNNLPKSVHGVGIPNLDKMKNSEITPGSLAEIVTTSSPAARRYAAYLLGDVIMASIATLRDHKRAISKECMRYSAYTASRIAEHVYSRWFIGKQARLKRMETLQKEIAALRDELESVEKWIKDINEKEDILRRVIESLYEQKGLKSAEENIAVLKKEQDEIEQQILAIDTDSFKDLQVQVASFMAAIKEHEEDIINYTKESGSLETKIDRLSIEIDRLKENEARLAQDFDRFEHEYLNLSDDFEKYYKERTGKSALREIQLNYESAMKGFATRLEKVRETLRKFKNNYNRDFTVYMSVDTENSDEFIALLKKFKETELPSYEEKIIRARLDAEKQFKDHFVSRLNEYITEARESFSELNHTLKIISFGQDQYRFSIEEQQEKRKILNVIKKAAEIAETKDTLWEQLTSPEEHANVEKLFNAILDNDLDSPEVRDICDYRQYFNYDIRIKHTGTIDEKSGKPLESSLSKVLREKSGGESQTPYYVAIAAGFYRFYKEEPGAVRLVLFDEAFNKMDDDRIGTTIGFFKKLKMQVITAVPTEKIETIAPHMDKTNLVIRRNYNTVVRDYEVLNDSAG